MQSILKRGMTLAPLFLAVALWGCAGVRAIVPQQSTVMDVRDRMGVPTDIRFDDNGDELWEYATGPMGTETYLVRIDRDGRVKETAQLLTTEAFEKVVPGRSTKRDVRRLLGRPSDVAFFNAAPVWEWRVDLGPMPGRFIVRFDRGGTVLDKMVIVDSSGDNERNDKGDDK